MSEYYTHNKMLDELETKAKKRYIEKYSKEEFEKEELDMDRMREIVDEFLTEEELLEYIRITFLEDGDEHLFYELFGDDDE